MDDNEIVLKIILNIKILKLSPHHNFYENGRLLESLSKFFIFFYSLSKSILL